MKQLENINPLAGRDINLAALPPFQAPEMSMTQDGSTFGVEQRITPEAATGELGGQALAGTNNTTKPFGIDLMTPVDEAKLGRKNSGSLPTNQVSTIINPHTKRPVRVSDGSDTSGDD